MRRLTATAFAALLMAATATPANAGCVGGNDQHTVHAPSPTTTTTTAPTRPPRSPG